MAEGGHFDRLFSYDRWANEQMIAALERSPAVPEKAMRLMAHIVAAEWLWLDRINLAPPRIAVWPELELQRIREENSVASAAWKEQIAKLDGEKDVLAIAYTNTRGERFESTIEEIATHVVMHSAYHRGQVATMLRESGEAAPVIDFIHATRQHLV